MKFSTFNATEQLPFVAQGNSVEANLADHRTFEAFKKTGTELLSSILQAGPDLTGLAPAHQVLIVQDNSYMETLKDLLTKAEQDIASQPSSTPAPNGASQTPAPTQSSSPSQAPIEVASLCAGNSQAVKTTSLVFPRNLNTCSFINPNKSETHGIKNGIVSVTQTAQFPAQSVVCSVTVSADMKKFSQSDVFVLSLNRVIAATNQLQTTSRIDPLSNLKSFDWTTEKSTPFFNSDSSKKNKYCPFDLGKCKLPDPATDQELDLFQTFSHSSRVYDPVADTSVALKLDVIGDNDSSDCQHEELKVDVILRYLTLD